MVDNVKTTITKLNNENYFTWKFKMELLLIKDEVWHVISGTPMTLSSDRSNQAAVDVWKKSDDKARAMIGLLVEDNQLSHIRSKTTAKQMWETLKEYHEKSTLSNKVILMRQICGAKMEEGGDMEEHIDQLTGLFQKLVALGETELSDNWTVAMILSSLPPSYNTLVTALETRPEADLTLSLVQSKLIGEHRQRKANGSIDNQSNNDSAMRVSEKETKLCFFCKRSGHLKRSCSSYIAWKERQERKTSEQAKLVGRNVSTTKSEQNEEYLFMVTTKGKRTSSNNNTEWTIDSAATSHTTGNKNLFVTLNYGNHGSVKVANDCYEKVLGKGTIPVKFVNELGKESTATLCDVLYTPAITDNLLSVKKLTSNGFKVIFEENSCKIIRGERQIGIGDCCGDLYKLRQSQRAYAVMSESHHTSKCIHYWHRILGHRDPTAIKEMSERGLVKNMEITDCKVKLFCDICAMAKMTRLPFPKVSMNKSNSVLDLIHSDVCGPMKTMSPSGKRYILTFIDDYSRFTKVFFLRQKSETETKLREYVEMTKTKFLQKPKMMRSDRGGEYVGNVTTKLLNSEGIQTQFTAPSTPQQNGVAERKNRSLVEMARCMLLDAKLSRTFWAEAINMANYLQNRLPTRAIEATPYELWNGKRPGVTHFQAFGTKCFVHIPAEKRHKLENTAKQMILVGYDEQSKAYRCYDQASKKLVISRDVRFAGFAETDSMNSTPNHKVNEEVNVNGQSNSDEFQDYDFLSEDDENKEYEEVIGENEIPAEDENHDDQHHTQQQQTLRQSDRRTKGIPPQRLIEEMKIVQHKVVEPKTLEEALNSELKSYWKQAIEDEMLSLKKNRTWELCELPKDRKAIGCKWTFKAKTDSNGNVARFKARLVAQGFSQKFGTDYDQVFAPVAKQTTFRTLLVIASKENLIVQHIDAKAAFLNGELEETIYMKQPPGFEEGEPNLVCKLKKSLYGLKQAAKIWNDAMHNLLTSGGFIQNRADPCLYKKKFAGECSYLLIFVDDIILAAKSNQEIESMKEFIASKFEIQDLGEVKQYLGIEVSKTTDNFYAISQSKYIQSILVDFGLTDAKESSIPMRVDYGSENNGDEGLLMTNSDYQKLIGWLLFLSVNTRPDISAAISILAQRVSQPRQEDWNELKRVVKYLKCTINSKLVLGQVEHNKRNELLHGYADASYADKSLNRKSISGNVFFVNGGLVSWSSRKQNCVALSSTEAEFVALSEACQEACWLRRLLEDMEQETNGPTVMYEDNQSCLKFIGEQKVSNRTKHIDTREYFVKDYVDRKMVSCVYCPTDRMLADLLTKPLAPARHELLRRMCGLND